MREDRRGIGRDQAADHQPDPADGQALEHCRKGDVVAEQTRVEIGKGLLDVGQIADRR